MFYRIEQVYKIFDKFGSNGIYSPTLLISGCQMFNVIYILSLFNLAKTSIWLFIIISLSLLIFNELYTFSRKKRETFADRWKDEKPLKKKVKGVLIILYIIASFILLIYGAI